MSFAVSRTIIPFSSFRLNAESGDARRLDPLEFGTMSNQPSVRFSQTVQTYSMRLPSARKLLIGLALTGLSSLAFSAGYFTPWFVSRVNSRGFKNVILDYCELAAPQQEAIVYYRKSQCKSENKNTLEPQQQHFVMIEELLSNEVDGVIAQLFNIDAILQTAMRELRGQLDLSLSNSTKSYLTEVVLFLESHQGVFFSDKKIDELITQSDILVDFDGLKVAIINELINIINLSILTEPSNTTAYLPLLHLIETAEHYSDLISILDIEFIPSVPRELIDITFEHATHQLEIIASARLCQQYLGLLQQQQAALVFSYKDMTPYLIGLEQQFPTPLPPAGLYKSEFECSTPAKGLQSNILMAGFYLALAGNHAGAELSIKRMANWDELSLTLASLQLEDQTRSIKILDSNIGVLGYFLGKNVNQLALSDNIFDSEYTLELVKQDVSAILMPREVARLLPMAQFLEPSGNNGLQEGKRISHYQSFVLRLYETLEKTISTSSNTLFMQLSDESQKLLIQFALDLSKRMQPFHGSSTQSWISALTQEFYIQTPELFPNETLEIFKPVDIIQNTTQVMERSFRVQLVTGDSFIVRATKASPNTELQPFIEAVKYVFRNSPTLAILFHNLYLKQSPYSINIVKNVSYNGSTSKDRFRSMNLNEKLNNFSSLVRVIVHEFIHNFQPKTRCIGEFCDTIPHGGDSHDTTQTIYMAKILQELGVLAAHGVDVENGDYSNNKLACKFIEDYKPTFKTIIDGLNAGDSEAALTSYQKIDIERTAHFISFNPQNLLLSSKGSPSERTQVLPLRQAVLETLIYAGIYGVNIDKNAQLPEEARTALNKFLDLIAALSAQDAYYVGNALRANLV